MSTALAAAVVGDHFHVHLSRGDVAPHAAHQHPVGAVESLGADVDFAVAAEAVAAGLAMASPSMMPPAVVRGLRSEQTVPLGSSTSRSMSASPVQVTITTQSRWTASIQGGLELVGLLGPFLGPELVEHFLGHAHARLPDVGLLLGPGLAENAEAGPLQSVEIVQRPGRLQAEHVGLGPDGLDRGGLAVDLQGPLVQSDLGQVGADVHQVGRVVDEIDGRHHRPLDLRLRPPGGVQRQGQGLVHPRLALAVPQGGVDQGDHVVELLLVHQPADGVADGGRLRLVLGEVLVPNGLRLGVLRRSRFRSWPAGCRSWRERRP